MRGKAALFAGLLLFIVPVAVGAVDVQNHQSANTGAYMVVHDSLVYVVSSNPGSSDASSCSGSIIQSDGTGSTILTAAHCVEGYTRFRVSLHEDTAHAVPAAIIRVGSGKNLQPGDGEGDLALLRIGVPNLKPLQIAEHADYGADVLKVGYPSVMLSLGEALQPQLHTGVISAPHASDWYVEYTASTDHGDSGGPVIETESKKLVAVVKGNFPSFRDVFVGNGPRAIRDFCARAGVACGTTQGTTVRANVNWSDYGPSFSVGKLAGLRASVRCVRAGPFNVWGVRIANNYVSTVRFDFDLRSSATAEPNYTRVELPNTTLYRLGPYVLDAPCGNEVWLLTKDRYVIGTTMTPSILSTQFNQRDPGHQPADLKPAPVIGNFRRPWAGDAARPDFSFTTRCIDLGVPSNRGRYIWQGRMQAASRSRVELGFSDNAQIQPAYRSYTIEPNTFTDSLAYLTNVSCEQSISWRYRSLQAM